MTGGVGRRGHRPVLSSLLVHKLDILLHTLLQ